MVKLRSSKKAGEGELTKKTSKKVVKIQKKNASKALKCVGGKKRKNPASEDLNTLNDERSKAEEIPLGDEGTKDDKELNSENSSKKRKECAKCLIWEEKYNAIVLELQQISGKSSSQNEPSSSKITRSNLQNSRKDADLHEEQIFKTVADDDNAVKLLPNYGIYIDELEKENLSKYGNTSILTRNVLGAIFKVEFLKNASINGKVDGTWPLPKKALNVITEFVFQEQNRFEVKESRSSIQLTISKRLGEYRKSN